MLSAAGMLAIAAISVSVAQLALAAFVLGIAYGASAPASTHLLVPHTPRPIFNMVMSLRQIGVPLGGVCAALLLPPLVGPLGWRGAMALLLVPAVALIVLMEIPRRSWDADLAQRHHHVEDRARRVRHQQMRAGRRRGTIGDPQHERRQRQLRDRDADRRDRQHPRGREHDRLDGANPAMPADQPG